MPAWFDNSDRKMYNRVQGKGQFPADTSKGRYIMASNYNGKDVTDIFENLDEKIDIIFRHQMLFSLYRNIPRDYDVGYFMGELEAHILGFIATQPGIVAKEIVKLTYRTKGTISLSLTKLEEQGLIEQHVNPSNKSERNLYLTDKGKEFHKHHKEYDRRLTCDYILRLLEHCTPEEINGFFKVSHYRSDYFEEVIKEERQKYEAYKKKQKNSAE